MKGAEERDLYFGRLFGYLTIVKSTRILDDAILVEKAFGKFIELYHVKSWIREAVIEAIFSLLDTIYHTDQFKPILNRLSGLYENSNGPNLLTDLSIDELLITAHLQNLINKSRSTIPASEVQLPFLPQDPVLAPDSVSTVIPQLLESSAHYPKVGKFEFFLIIVRYIRVIIMLAIAAEINILLRACI